MHRLVNRPALWWTIAGIGLALSLFCTANIIVTGKPGANILGVLGYFIVLIGIANVRRLRARRR